MRNLKKAALVVAATGGILFAGVGPASAAAAHIGGDYIPVLSNFKQLDWEDSPFCGTQIKTVHSKQEVSCPVAHLEDSPHSNVVIIS